MKGLTNVLSLQRGQPAAREGLPSVPGVKEAALPVGGNAHGGSSRKPSIFQLAYVDIDVRTELELV